MGGHAFRSGPNPLNVIRMPTKQYIKLRDHYQKFAIPYLTIHFGLADFSASILLKFYNRAVVPPEAPEKVDHGDIDVLVDEPVFTFTGQDLQEALGADAYMKAGRISSFAIRIPEEGSNYFQLDVRCCKKGCLEWENVIYAYGDLWHIIGSTVTRFGFTINDSGLHARVRGIEETNRKDRLLLLTSKPQEMMDFLGLDRHQYEKGFSTLDQVFEWATSTPLHRKGLLDKETISGKQERIREKRPMYSKFVTVWLPQRMTMHQGTATPGMCEAKDYGTDNSLSAGSSISSTAQSVGNGLPIAAKSGPSFLNERKDLLDRALQRFNKREGYESMLEDDRKTILKDTMWKKIATALPLKGKELGQAMMALKALLWWNQGQPTL